MARPCPFGGLFGVCMRFKDGGVRLHLQIFSCWTTTGLKIVRDGRSYAVISQELAVDSIQPRDNDTAFFSNPKQGPMLEGSNLKQVIEL